MEHLVKVLLSQTEITADLRYVFVIQVITHEQLTITEGRHLLEDLTHRACAELRLQTGSGIRFRIGKFVDGGLFAGGTTVVRATNLRQSQTGGNRNTQSMLIGKIDKDVGGAHLVTVTANNITQSQNQGSRNEQKIKIGVIE